MAFPGDRGWAVFDETRGGVTNAKRLPALRAFRVRYLSAPSPGEASPPIEITLPDGGTVCSDAPDAAERLSSALGREVSLRALGPAGSASATRLTMGDESDAAARAMMGLEPGEPEPDMSAFPPERLRLLRQDNFFDAMPIHLLSRATLRTLGRIAPESSWDERRFRMNILIEAEGDYPELGWIGRRVRVGGAVLEIATGCPRCVVPTQAVDELPRDPRIMRTLVRETKHTAGVYAGVVEEGVVRPGDPVELLPV
ncbi:MAG: MOSC domain-containing protein [Candidatus Eisenbacteria bacterium]